MSTSIYIHKAYELALEWGRVHKLEPLPYPNLEQYLGGIVHDACHAQLQLGITLEEEALVVLFQFGCIGWPWDVIKPDNNKGFEYWVKGLNAPEWIKDINRHHPVWNIL